MTPNPFLDEAKVISADEWALVDRLFQEHPQLLKIPRGNKAQEEHRNQHKKSFRQRINELFNEADARAIIATLTHSFVKIGDVIYAQLPQKGALLGEGGQATIKLAVGKKIGAPASSVELDKPVLLRIDKKAFIATDKTGDEVAASMDLGLITATGSRSVKDIDPYVNGEQHYSVMPYLGQDIRQWSATVKPTGEIHGSRQDDDERSSHAPPSRQQSLAIAAKLIWHAEALKKGYLSKHGLPYAHRDIKPENVVLDAKGTPRLIDFGTACNEPHRYPSANAVGTVAYQMPFSQCNVQTNAVLDLTGLLRTLYLPKQVLDGSGFKMERERFQPTLLSDKILHESQLEPSLFLPEVVVRQKEATLVSLASTLTLASLGMQGHIERIAARPLAQQALMVLLHSDQFDTEHCKRMLESPVLIQALSLLAPLLTILPASTINTIVSIIFDNPLSPDWFTQLDTLAQLSKSINDDVRFGHFLLRQIISLPDGAPKSSFLSHYKNHLTVINEIERDHRHINLLRFCCQKLGSGTAKEQTVTQRILLLDSPVSRHLTYRLMREDDLSEIKLQWLELLDQSPNLNETIIDKLLGYDDDHLCLLLDTPLLAELANNSDTETFQALLALIQSPTPDNAEAVKVLHALNRRSELLANQRLVLATSGCAEVCALFTQAKDWQQPSLVIAVAKTNLTIEELNMLTDSPLFRQVAEAVMPFIEAIPSEVKMALINEFLTPQHRQPWAETLLEVARKSEREVERVEKERNQEPKDKYQKKLKAVETESVRQRGLILREMISISQFGSEKWLRLALSELRKEAPNLHKIEAFIAIDKLRGIDESLMNDLEVKGHVDSKAIPVLCVLHAIGVMDNLSQQSKAPIAESILHLLDKRKECDCITMIFKLMQFDESSPVYSNSRLPIIIVTALARFVTSGNKAFYGGLLSWFKVRLDNINHSQCQDSQQGLDTMVSRLNRHKESIEQLSPPFAVIAFNGLTCDFTHCDEVLGARETMLELLVHLSEIPGLANEIESKGINTLFGVVGLLCRELCLLNTRVQSDSTARTHLEQALTLRDTLITTQLDKLIIAEMNNPKYDKAGSSKGVPTGVMQLRQAAISTHCEEETFITEAETIAERHLSEKKSEFSLFASARRPEVESLYENLQVLSRHRTDLVSRQQLGNN